MVATEPLTEVNIKVNKASIQQFPFSVSSHPCQISLLCKKGCSGGREVKDQKVYPSLSSSRRSSRDVASCGGAVTRSTLLLLVARRSVVCVPRCPLAVFDNRFQQLIRIIAQKPDGANSTKTISPYSDEVRNRGRAVVWRAERNNSPVRS